MTVIEPRLRLLKVTVMFSPGSRSTVAPVAVVVLPPSLSPLIAILVRSQPARASLVNGVAARYQIGEGQAASVTETESRRSQTGVRQS